jgi:hypothetical protein
MAQRQHQHSLIRPSHLNYIITIPLNPFPIFPTTTTTPILNSIPSPSPIPYTPKILELPYLRSEVPFNITLNSGFNIKFFLIHIQKLKKKIYLVIVVSYKHAQN